MTKNKYEEVLSKALLANSSEESMKILRDGGLFDSIQCHGYAICGKVSNEDSLKTNDENNRKKKTRWWQFWK